MHFHTIPKRIRLIGIYCCGCSSRKLNYNLVTWGNIIKRSNLHVSEPHAEMIETWKKEMTLTYIWCCNQEKEYEIPPKKQFVPTMIFAVKDFFFSLSHNGLLKVLKNYMCSGWKSLVLLQMFLLNFYVLFSFLLGNILHFLGDLWFWLFVLKYQPAVQYYQLLFYGWIWNDNTFFSVMHVLINPSHISLCIKQFRQKKLKCSYCDFTTRNTKEYWNVFKQLLLKIKEWFLVLESNV